MNDYTHIGKKINIFAHRMHRKIDNEAAKYGITGTQARILGFILRESVKRDIFQKDIEEYLDIRRSSVTSVLQLMEKNECIERISVAEDARLKKIVITEKGLEIDRNVYEYIMQLEKSLHDELSKDEIKTFVNLIDRLSEKVVD